MSITEADLRTHRAARPQYKAFTCEIVNTRKSKRETIKAWPALSPEELGDFVELRVSGFYTNELK